TTSATTRSRVTSTIFPPSRWENGGCASATSCSAASAEGSGFNGVISGRGMTGWVKADGGVANLHKRVSGFAHPTTLRCTKKSLPARGGRRYHRSLPSPQQPNSVRLRDDAQVGARRLPAVRVSPLGILVAHRAGDDDLLTLLPVGGRRHLVLGGQ